MMVERYVLQTRSNNTHNNVPKWLRKCLTNSIPSSTFFQNLTCPSWLAVITKSVLQIQTCKRNKGLGSERILLWANSANESTSDLGVAMQAFTKGYKM